MASAFRSLKYYNYRIWATGALVSNIGTWMQRMGQEWLVFNDLTNHQAQALGILAALQFGPHLILLPLTGMVIDTMNRRKLLIVTQTLMGLLALLLAGLTLTGVVQLWHVYVVGLALGCVTAFDAAARQTFVSELVPQSDLSNAVALNATSFNSARMIGPAVAGILIAYVQTTGWVFLINASTFIVMLSALFLLSSDQLIPRVFAPKGTVKLLDGVRYVRKRHDILIIFFMFFIIGAFSINFSIYTQTMAVKVFQLGADHVGYLTTCLAIGSVAGALLSAKRSYPHIFVLIFGALSFGVALVIASLVQSYMAYAVMLVFIGLAVQTFTNTANGRVQLSTESHIRGRVMALYLGLSVGSTLIGAPIMGRLADFLGPRATLATGGLFAVLTALVGLWYLYRYRNLRFTMSPRRMSLYMDKDTLPPTV